MHLLSILVPLTNDRDHPGRQWLLDHPEAIEHLEQALQQWEKETRENPGGWKENPNKA